LNGFLKGAAVTVALMLTDLGAYFASLFIAWAARQEVFYRLVEGLHSGFSYGYYMELWWIPLITGFFLTYFGLYTARLPFWDETKWLLHALTISMLVMMTVVTLGRMEGRVSRVVLMLLWGCSLAVFPTFRFLAKRALFKSGVLTEKVLILGAGDTGRLVQRWLRREKHIGYEVIGFLDDDPAKAGTFVDGSKVFGGIRHYTRFVKELRINTIIVAIPSLAAAEVSSLAFRIQQDVKNTLIVPDISGIALLNTRMMHLFYEETFLLQIGNNLKSLPNMLVKRAFDLAVSLALLPFLVMLIVIIGLSIKLESRGPVFYSHRRVGRGGRLFNCYKFRTMALDAEERLAELLRSNSETRDEWQKYWKLRNDPRVTRIGSLLRKTSLDELPQIFNVLKGEMSLIGPRPYLPRELDQLGAGIEAITKVAPGITGLWQVSGRSDTTYLNRIRLDTWYIMNWTLWLDVYILLKTVMVVLSTKGGR
jgi:undecaprenyl-phosphate galactose phosphotransferase